MVLYQTEEEEEEVVEFLQQQVEGEVEVEAVEFLRQQVEVEVEVVELLPQEVEVEVVEFLQHQVEEEEPNHKHLKLGQERDYFLEYKEEEVVVVVEG